MKTKNGFVMRNVCGENIIVAEGLENINFNNIISMNDSSAFLWNKVQGKDFDTTTLTKLLCEEYEVDEATATKDTERLLNDWVKAGIVE